MDKIAIIISIIAVIITTFPILKYYIIERGRVKVYMSNFIHQPDDSVKTGSDNQIFGNTKFHPQICVKNIGKTLVKNLEYKIIEKECTLSKYNKNALKQAYPVKYLEPNMEQMIHIFNSRTSDQMIDVVMSDKEKLESICIKIRYKDMWGMPHTDTFRLPFYSSLYQPKTEIQEISSWLRNIRDEMRAISSNLGMISNEIRNSKKNQVN
ncbi:MAG: hypothetical protein OXU36_02505 [Candidatus Poribacteria bacterium]|nr:hypothetical protein [Candidatus Poribacteria bacterium]